MGILEALGWIGMTVIKFAITPSLMIGNGYQFWETWILTSASACVSVTLFYFFGSAIFKWVGQKRKKEKSGFSARGRRTVTFLRKFGLIGLTLTSVFLSVPIAGVLSAKFFRDPRVVLPVLYFAFTGWSLLLTYFSVQGVAFLDA